MLWYLAINSELNDRPRIERERKALEKKERERKLCLPPEIGLYIFFLSPTSNNAYATRKQKSHIIERSSMSHTVGDREG